MQPFEPAKLLGSINAQPEAPAHRAQRMEAQQSRKRRHPGLSSAQSYAKDLIDPRIAQAYFILEKEDG